jgi:hypothetical protein
MRIHDSGDAPKPIAECCSWRFERETSPRALLRTERRGVKVYLNGALSMTVKRMKQMDGPESR